MTSRTLGSSSESTMCPAISTDSTNAGFGAAMADLRDTRATVTVGPAGRLVTVRGVVKMAGTVAVAQLVRAPDCGSGGRGFESRQSPLCQTRPVGAEKCQPAAPFAL